MLEDMEKIESIANVAASNHHGNDPFGSAAGASRRSRRDFSESLKIESEIRKSDKSKRKPRRNASMENLSKASSRPSSRASSRESSVPSSPLAAMTIGGGSSSLPTLDLMSGLDALGAAVAELEEAGGGEKGPKARRKMVRRNVSLPTSLSSLTAHSNFMLNDAPSALGQYEPGASVQAPEAMPVEAGEPMRIEEAAAGAAPEVAASGKRKKNLRRNSSLPISLNSITVRSDIQSGLTPIIEGQRLGEAGAPLSQVPDMTPGGVAPPLIPPPSVDEVAQLRSENELLRQQLSQQAPLYQLLPYMDSIPKIEPSPSRPI